MTGGSDHTSGCPTCGKILRYRDPLEHKYFPFCSERCKMVDLGRWLEGEYRVGGEEPSEPEGEKKA
jgi:hypothetical protein